MSKITFRKGKNPISSYDGPVWFLYFDGEKHKHSRVISVLTTYDGAPDNEIGYYLVMCNGDYIRDSNTGYGKHYATVAEAKQALVAKFNEEMENHITMAIVVSNNKYVKSKS